MFLQVYRVHSSAPWTELGSPFQNHCWTWYIKWRVIKDRRLIMPWTRVSCTAGDFLHCKRNIYQLSHQETGPREYACVHAQSCPTSATPWRVAHQASLSMEFSRQEYWNGLPFPTPGCLPDTWIEPESPASPALARGFFTAVPPGKSSDSWGDLKGMISVSPCIFPYI